MIITAMEVFQIFVVIGFVGYIFMDIFKPRDFMAGYASGDLTRFYRPGFDWEGFKFAALVTAPAIILHEFGHKFVAMLFGMHATFHAAYLWLFIGLALKVLGVGFIFFIPGYVSWGCPAGDFACLQTLTSSPWIGGLIAFSGPAINLLLWQGTKWYMANHKVKKKYVPACYLTQQINKFLFFFNMLPIPPFDGFGVFQGLLSLF